MLCARWDVWLPFSDAVWWQHGAAAVHCASSSAAHAANATDAPSATPFMQLTVQRRICSLRQPRARLCWNLGVTDDKSFPIVQAKKDATDSFIIEDWEAALVGTTTGEQHAVDGRRAMPEPEWV